MSKWISKVNLFMAGLGLGMVFFSIVTNQPWMGVINGVSCIINLYCGINDE